MRHVGIIIICISSVPFPNTICDTIIKNITDTIVQCSCYSSNEVLIEFMRLKNGNLDGVQKTWHASGKIKSILHYKNGCQTDSLIVYHENGNVNAFATFRKCKCHGISVRFAENSDTTGICHYSNGRRVGICRYWYSNGNPKEFMEFNKDGKKTGVEKTWWENGTLKDSMIMVNGISTTGIEYFKNGKKRIWHKKCFIAPNKESGVKIQIKEMVTYYPNGSVFCHITKGNGLLKWYSSDGKNCYKINIKNYQKNGIIENCLQDN